MFTLHDACWITENCFKGNLICRRMVLLVSLMSSHYVSITPNTSQTDHAMMATLTDYVVSLSWEGQISSCGTVSKALKKHKTLSLKVPAPSRMMKDWHGGGPMRWQSWLMVNSSWLRIAKGHMSLDASKVLLISDWSSFMILPRKLSCLLMVWVECTQSCSGFYLPVVCCFTILSWLFRHGLWGYGTNNMSPTCWSRARAS